MTRRIARTLPLAAIALALDLLAGSAHAQVPRLFDPESEDLLYDLAEAAALRADVAPPYAMAKPWSSRDLAALLQAVDSAAAVAASPAVPDWMLEPLRRAAGGAEEIPTIARAGESVGAPSVVAIEQRFAVTAAAGEHELDPTFRSIRRRRESGSPDAALGAELRAGYSWRPGAISGVVELRAETDTRNEFDVPARDADGAVNVRSAYVLWEKTPLLAAAGRLPVEWGNGPLGGIGLTAVGPALDGFLARGRWGIAQLTILSALLPDERANRRLDPDGDTIAGSRPGNGAVQVNRAFYAHRLDLRFGDDFTMSIDEMALVSGIRRRPDLQFLVGLIPYTVVQNSREEIDRTDVNLGAGLQYRWRLPGRVLLYGEYFANEIFLGDPGATLEGLLGRRSNAQGVQQGIRWAAPFGWERLDIEGEIVLLDRLLFLHRGLNTNWQRGGVPIGAPLGPDDRRVLLQARVYHPMGGGLLRGTIGLIWRERGVGRITDDIGVRPAGARGRGPSSPTEESWLGRAGAELWWPRLGSLGVALVGGRVENLNNLAGEEITPLDLELTLKLGADWSHDF